MTDLDNSSNDSQPPVSFWKTRAGAVLVVFLTVAGLLLAYEHRVHIFAGNGFLIALLAVCIGIHLFMHSGHGGHGDHDDKNDGSNRGGGK